ncbi:hypothetical protein SuNHUV7_19280 (plasmid) [Pseudoseohaeicola sp. NH-UV-7]
MLVRLVIRTRVHLLPFGTIPWHSPPETGLTYIKRPIFMTHMPPPYFFGYGSLVNRTTHDYGNPTRATAQGWRRLWRHTGKRPVAFLTVVPDPSCRIDGLIASVPGADWAALDAREWAYDRVAASDQIRHDLDHRPAIHLYTVAPDQNHAPDTRHPILLSYIDVVVQGYLTEFGVEGALRFFETTDGWEAPILNDRAAPVYARHRSLTDFERRFVDQNLEALSARIDQPEGLSPKR